MVWFGGLLTVASRRLKEQLLTNSFCFLTMALRTKINDSLQSAYSALAGFCQVLLFREKKVAVEQDHITKMKMETVRYDREELTYEDLSGKFQLNNRIFNRQYAHIYAVRLMRFKAMLDRRVESKWGKSMTRDV